MTCKKILPIYFFIVLTSLFPQDQVETLDLFEEAHVYVERGELFSAITLLNQVLDQNPHYDEATIYLAGIYYQLKQWSLAKSALDRVQITSISPLSLYVLKVKVELANKNFEEANQLIDTLLAQYVDNQKGHLLRGLLYILQGDLNLAEELYLKQLEQYNPFKKEIYTSLVILYSLKNERDKIEKYINLLGVVDPHNLRTNRLLANYYLYNGLLGTAANYLMFLYDNNAYFEYTLTNLSLIYLMEENNEKARKYFLELLATSSDSYLGILGLALSYSKDDPEKMLDLLHQYFPILGENPYYRHIYEDRLRLYASLDSSYRLEIAEYYWQKAMQAEESNDYKDILSNSYHAWLLNPTDNKSIRNYAEALFKNNYDNYGLFLWKSLENAGEVIPESVRIKRWYHKEVQKNKYPWLPSSLPVLEKNAFPVKISFFVEKIENRSFTMNNSRFIVNRLQDILQGNPGFTLDNYYASDTNTIFVDDYFSAINEAKNNGSDFLVLGKPLTQEKEIKHMFSVIDVYSQVELSSHTSRYQFQKNTANFGADEDWLLDSIPRMLKVVELTPEGDAIVETGLRHDVKITDNMLRLHMSEVKGAPRVELISEMLQKKEENILDPNNLYTRELLSEDYSLVRRKENDEAWEVGEWLLAYSPKKVESFEHVVDRDIFLETLLLNDLLSLY